jgi:uncharacterized membrane protein YbhN (UPF0104 family)
MVLSPGKVGELWKAWLLRDDHDVPVGRSSPVVAVERLTDLVGVVALAVVGSYAFQRSTAITLGLLGALVAGIVLLRHRPTCEAAFDLAARLPRAGTAADTLRRLYDNSYALLRVDVLAVTVGLSVVSWFCECLGLWLLLSGFGVDATVLEAAFVFAFASVVGTLSFLPGGVGATEGSMTLLLVELGAPRSAAVGATLLVRAATLWFSASLALAALPGYRVHRRRVASGSD